MDRNTVFLIFLIVKFVAAMSSSRSNDGQFIYQASVQHRDRGHICNGAIVHVNFILTTTQCVNEFEETPEILKVFYGSNNLNDTGHIVIVKKVNVHSSFDHEYIKNDIAMLETPNMQFIPGVSGLINLPKHENPFDRLFTSSGWNVSVSKYEMPTCSIRAVIQSMCI